MAVTMPSGQAFAFEQRALLDVEFDPGVIVVRRQAHAGERAGEAGGGADLGEGFVFGAALRAVECVGAVGVETCRRSGGCRCSRCRSGWALRK